MKQICKLMLTTLALTLVLTAGLPAADKGTLEDPYTLAGLAENIQSVEKQEVVLSATIVGACKSGCKMWVADGDYEKGDLFALVRAKDDAYKFDTAASGKTAVLHGFAVAKMMDYCAEETQKKAEDKEKCESAVEKADAAAGTENVTKVDVAAVETAEASAEAERVVKTAAAETEAQKDHAKCAAPVENAKAAAETEKKMEITFFASKVEYK